MAIMKFPDCTVNMLMDRAEYACEAFVDAGVIDANTDIAAEFSFEAYQPETIGFEPVYLRIHGSANIRALIKYLEWALEEDEHRQLKLHDGKNIP